MNYQSKNNSNLAWFLPVGLLIIDFIIIGGDTDLIGYIVLPTLIGGFIGALILWAGNKDMSISIDGDKLKIKKDANNSREYLKEEIESYRISTDQGKTVIRICGNDKSEFELASYLLDLNGFESAMKEFLKK
jgi:hypothetical protein